MRYVTFVFMVNLAMLLTACTPVAEMVEWVYHDEWSEQTYQVPYSEWSGVAHRGVGVGFVRPEDRLTHPYQRPPNDKFYIQAGTPFTTLLILDTGYETAYPVLVTVFVDYEQVHYELDGQPGRLHYVTIPPQVDMEIPFEVSIKTAGWHDLFVVVFPKPENRPTDAQQRLPPAFAVHGNRIVVCAGDCTLPTGPLPAALEGQVVDMTRMLSSYTFAVSPDDGRPARHRLLLAENVAPGAILPVELWGSNPATRTIQYVVLPLLDFQQIAFAGSNKLHIRMPPQSEFFVPGDVQLPAVVGVHEAFRVPLGPRGDPG